MRIGVVVIHGIAPHPRYEIQDQFATALTDRLNESGRAGHWNLTSEFTPFTAPRDPESVRMTVNRVSNGPDMVDVAEAYWSPIDKHQTTPLSVAGWLLKTIFTPLNNSAKFPGRPKKAAFDVLYVLAALAIAAIFVGAAFYFGGRSYYDVVTKLLPGGEKAPNFIDVLTNPFKLFSQVQFTDTLIVLAGLAGAVFLAQAISAILGGAVVRRGRTAAAPGKQPHAGRVFLRIAFVALAGITLLLVSALTPLHSGAMGTSIWVFVATVLALQGASSVGRGFLVDRLGDVQIYTIGDENSKFFTFRQQIRTQAENVLLDTIRRKSGAQPYYDKIVVAAHSLGTTIGMDALIRVHEIHEATLQPGTADSNGIGDDDWDRVRAFITFGTALEKTKFFFAALRPSFSAAREQWRSDLYGHLFTPDPAVLRSANSKTITTAADDALPRGIFWLNFWYPTDPIANGIDSYRSTKLPRIPKQSGNDRLVALNHRLQLPFWSHPFPHSDYLGDRNFWLANGGGAPGAADVITDLLGYPR